jgi:hypothetical protein
MKDIQKAQSFSDIWENFITDEERRLITAETEKLKKRLSKRKEKRDNNRFIVITK